MTYDYWKATDPADEWLGSNPDWEPEDEPEIITRYDPKPIPDRRFDWSAVTDNYDLGHPVGYGRTEQDAIDDLRAQLDE